MNRIRERWMAIARRRPWMWTALAVGLLCAGWIALRVWPRSELESVKADFRAIRWSWFDVEPPDDRQWRHILKTVRRMQQLSPDDRMKVWLTVVEDWPGSRAPLERTFRWRVFSALNLNEAQSNLVGDELLKPRLTFIAELLYEVPPEKAYIEWRNGRPMEGQWDRTRSLDGTAEGVRRCVEDTIADYEAKYPLRDLDALERAGSD